MHQYILNKSRSSINKLNVLTTNYLFMLWESKCH
ncbi:hypothetical protein BVRB_4g071320 [Beta vulgaris subsp. vulgaris]|nr:hypothetical protein BVRB_4g071320 [Beta vulgaris subsp. vulgaris]